MSILHYIFYQCKNSICGLRFPAQEGSLSNELCPRCRAPLEKKTLVDIPQEADERSDSSSGIVLEACLDNIRSAWNVGSMFRTADGTGIQCLYLCGITPTPDHPQVRRTALGAEQSIPWHYESNSLRLLQNLVSLGRQLWVLEDTPVSTNLFELDIEACSLPIVLVVGNEICGVDPALQESADRVISIPMVGMKRSYNVAVAFGVAASFLRYCQNFSGSSAKKLPNT